MTAEPLDYFVIHIRNGLSVAQNADAGGLPITRIETIANGTINAHRVGYAGLTENASATWLLQNGDILFSHINSTAHLGKVAIYGGQPEKLVHGMNLLCIRPNIQRIDPRYLLYALRSGAFRKQLNKTIKPAVNQASIAISDLKKLQLSVPDLPEQRRIAEILDKADALRAKRRAALAQLDTLTQSIFLDMFGDPSTNPKKWPSATLGDVVVSASDGPHVSPNYTREGVPFLSTRHVRAGEIAWKDLKFISEGDAAVHWRKCKPTVGDVIYTKGGTTGLAAVVRSDRPFAVWVHLAILKPSPHKVESTWLEAMLNSKYCYAQSQKLTRGIANHDLGLMRMVRINITCRRSGSKRSSRDALPPSQMLRSAIAIPRLTSKVCLARSKTAPFTESCDACRDTRIRV